MFEDQTVILQLIAAKKIYFANQTINQNDWKDTDSTRYFCDSQLHIFKRWCHIRERYFKDGSEEQK